MLDRFWARVYADYDRVWIQKSSDSKTNPYGIYSACPWQQWPWVHVEAGATTLQEAEEKLEKLKNKVKQARKDLEYYNNNPIVRETIREERV